VPQIDYRASVGHSKRFFGKSDRGDIDIWAELAVHQDIVHTLSEIDMVERLQKARDVPQVVRTLLPPKGIFPSRMLISRADAFRFRDIQPVSPIAFIAGMSEFRRFDYDIALLCLVHSGHLRMGLQGHGLWVPDVLG